MPKAPSKCMGIADPLKMVNTTKITFHPSLSWGTETFTATRGSSYTLLTRSGKKLKQTNNSHTVFASAPLLCATTLKNASDHQRIQAATRIR